MRGILFHYWPEINWRGTSIESAENVVATVVEIQPDPNYYLDPSISAEDLKIAYMVLAKEIVNGHDRTTVPFYHDIVVYSDIQRAIASNPNAPTEILVLAAKDYPESVLNNPMFSFLLITDPTLKQFPFEAIYRLTMTARQMNKVEEAKALTRILSNRHPDIYEINGILFKSVEIKSR